jgi:hypothetical protein
MATKRILKKILTSLISFFSFSEDDLNTIAKTIFIASFNKRH